MPLSKKAGWSFARVLNTASHSARKASFPSSLTSKLLKANTFYVITLLTFFRLCFIAKWARQHKYSHVRPHLPITSSAIYTESVSFLHNDPWILMMHSSAPPFSRLTVWQLYILSPSLHNIRFFQYLHVLEQYIVPLRYSVFRISSPHIHNTILLLQIIFSHIGASTRGKLSILISVIKCHKLPKSKQKIRWTMYFPV